MQNVLERLTEKEKEYTELLNLKKHSELNLEEKKGAMEKLKADLLILDEAVIELNEKINEKNEINIKNIKDNVLPTDINDYNIILDNNIYMPGTANHELGHVADGLAGSRKIQDFDSGKEYITNTYLNYLANSNNTYSSAELRKMGLFDAAGSRSYLLNPTEAKSHMLTLKRSLKDSGKITNWSTPVDENMILEYMRNPTSNKMVKNQYDLYRNKNEYIDRLNKLIPMEILMPLGGAGFVGHELNKE